MRQNTHNQDVNDEAKKTRLEKYGWCVGSVDLLLESLFALDAKCEEVTQILVS